MLNATANAQQASLVFMDNLPPNLLSYEVGFLSITDNGTVIGVTVEQATPIGTGITWSQQKGWTLLPKPGPEWNVVAQGASRDGRYIAGIISLPPTYTPAMPVAWIDGEGPFVLFEPPEPYDQAFALDVSDAEYGYIVAGLLLDDGPGADVPFLFDGEKITNLGNPQGANISIADINSPKTILGTSGNILNGSVEGVRWREGIGWEFLGDLPGCDSFSRLYGSSANAMVGVGQATPGLICSQAFARWTQYHGWQDYYVPSVIAPGRASNVSGDGWRAVGSTGNAAPPPYQNGATIWDPVNGARYLQNVLFEEYGISAGEWRLWDIEAISYDGTMMAGQAVRWNGIQLVYRQFFVTLPAFCYADCNGDDELNVLDYFCFAEQFSQRTVYANCDNDGRMNIFDFICFGNKFAEGCP
ncbi:MAG: hypothetical protein H6815_08035 [Phycisphaeraceae bacterium]|nr:hypothetical protein [Phycisphaeraceae bacterium]